MTSDEVYDKFFIDEEYELENAPMELYSFRGGWNCGLRRACVMLADKIKPENRWIPVSERIPDEKDNYWISVYDGTYTRTDIGTYYPDKECWSICDANGFYWAEDKDDVVIAWQPLPEPYKEADKEK